MGYDLLAAVAFVVLTPLVILGFIVFWMVNARDHEALAALWRSYAASRGLEYLPPRGEWPNRTSAAITWSDESARLRLSTIGREAQVRTRLTIRPRATLLGTLVWICDARSAVPRMRERPAGFGQRLLNERVTRVLLGFRQRDRVTFAYRKGRVTVEWPGGELNDARLDDARRMGEAIARAIDDEFHAAASQRRPAA